MDEKLIYYGMRIALGFIVITFAYANLKKYQEKMYRIVFKITIIGFFVEIISNTRIFTPSFLNLIHDVASGIFFFSLLIMTFYLINNVYKLINRDIRKDFDKVLLFAVSIALLDLILLTNNYSSLQVLKATLAFFLAFTLLLVYFRYKMINLKLFWLLLGVASFCSGLGYITETYFPHIDWVFTSLAYLCNIVGLHTALGKVYQ